MRKTASILQKYFNSNYFIVITYLFTIFCWVLENQNLAMIYYAIMGILIILLDARRTNLITLVMAGIINYRETTFEANVGIIITIVIIAAPVLIYDIIKTKLNYKNPIFLALLLFLLANTLSIVNITNDTLLLWAVGVAQVVAFAFIFLYFFTHKHSESQEYVGKNALALGLSIAFQFFMYMISYEGEAIGKDIHLGWGISNSIAMTLLMVIPLTIFLYINNQNKSYILIFIVLDILLIILMLSKGAYITLAVIFIPLIIIALLFVENKRRMLFDGLISAIIFILLLIFVSQLNILSEGIVEYLSRMDSRGWFDDKARIEIYTYGFEIFKKFPLFGSGSYTSGYYLVQEGMSDRLKHYHNYIVQTLATLGITGMASFIYFIFVAIKNTFKKYPYHLLVFIAILAMLLHGLVDNTWHNPIVMVVITIYLSQLDTNESEKVSK